MKLTFAGLAKAHTRYENSHYVVLPVPYDRTSTWGKGADRGPTAILEASANMELYDIETQSEPYLAGIFTAEPLVIDEEPEIMYETVLAQARGYQKDGKFLITIGGDHSVAIGASQACCENHRDVSILQIDAHSDMRESYHGSRYNHACVMARMKEWGKPVMVGIRSMDISERENIQGRDIFYASYIHQHSHWIQKVLECLTDHVYLTVDLDGFDPSILPATGTPEPGGLGWYQVLNLFEAVARQKKLIGLDVTELCPNENSRASNFLAAKLIYKVMALNEFYRKGKNKNES